MKPMTKKILMYSIPAALIAAFALGLRPTPLPVDTAAVSRGPLRVTLDEEGETRVRDRFVVSAPFTGRILRIELEPGEPVRTGGVVAVMRPAEANLLDTRSRASSEARVRTAEAALGRARADRERAAPSCGLRSPTSSGPSRWASRGSCRARRWRWRSSGSRPVRRRSR